jgi:hypothetical protein
MLCFGHARTSCQNYKATLSAPKKARGRRKTGSWPKKMKRNKRRNEGASYVSDAIGKNVAGSEL